jgi:hypothetical protein
VSRGETFGNLAGGAVLFYDHGEFVFGDQMLDLGHVVTGRNNEPTRICSHRSIGRQRQLDPLNAAGGRAPASRTIPPAWRRSLARPQPRPYS